LDKEIATNQIRTPSIDGCLRHSRGHSQGKSTRTAGSTRKRSDPVVPQPWIRIAGADNPYLLHQLGDPGIRHFTANTVHQQIHPALVAEIIEERAFAIAHSFAREPRALVGWPMVVKIRKQARSTTGHSSCTSRSSDW